MEGYFTPTSLETYILMTHPEIFTFWRGNLFQNPTIMISVFKQVDLKTLLALRLVCKSVLRVLDDYPQSIYTAVARNTFPEYIMRSLPPPAKYPGYFDEKGGVLTLQALQILQGRQVFLNKLAKGKLLTTIGMSVWLRMSEKRVPGLDDTEILEKRISVLKNLEYVEMKYFIVAFHEMTEIMRPWLHGDLLQQPGFWPPDYTMSISASPRFRKWLLSAFLNHGPKMAMPLGAIECSANYKLFRTEWKSKTKRERGRDVMDFDTFNVVMIEEKIKFFS